MQPDARCYHLDVTTAPPEAFDSFSTTANSATNYYNLYLVVNNTSGFSSVYPSFAIQLQRKLFEIFH